MLYNLFLFLVNMNMKKKNILINPNFLKLKQRKRSQKKKPDFKKALKKTDIKKALLNRIKHHKENKMLLPSLKLGGGKDITNDEFKQSIEYLNSIKMKSHKSKQPNSKQKSHKSKQPSLIRPDPPYGILKSGKKPLYRDFVKSTQKKKNKLSFQSSAAQQDNRITIHDNEKKPPSEIIIERQAKLKKLKKKYKIRKRRFELGKSLKRRKIGVLIKNLTMKKEIQKELQRLKKEPLHNIKKNLQKKGLIRIGSFAPENVIRNIYEDSKSAGDVFNVSTDILLHNYLNTK